MSGRPHVPAIIGCDPGKTTGICVLILLSGDWSSSRPEAEFAQVSGGLVIPLVEALLRDIPGAQLAVEKFVVGPRAGKSSSAKDSALTRQLIGALEALAPAACAIRPAAQVKPWATDERLDAAGLLEPTKAARHARDGARHALFHAVSSCGFPDPFSSRRGR